jgi:hypothetical protein
MANKSPETLVNVQVFAGKDGTTPMPGDFLLTSLEIKKSINKIPQATLVFVDGGVAEHEKFVVIESGLFDQWNKVVIKAGYNNVIEKKPLFEGYIFDQQLTLGSPNKFTVTCFNQAKYLTMASMNDVLEKKNPIEAVDYVLKNNEYASKAKGKVDGVNDSKAEKKDQIILDPQVNCWKYVMDNLSHYIAVPYDDELSVQIPDFKQSAADVEIKYGKNIRSFSIKEASNSLRPIEIKGYDEKKPDEPLTTKKEAKQIYGSFSKYLNSDSETLFSVNKVPEFISGSHIHTQADMENILESRKFQNLLNFKTGKVVISGTGKVELATIVDVEGLPEEYSQSYFVSGIDHKFTSDWVTTVHIGLSGTGLGSSSSGGGSSSSSSSTGRTSTSAGAAAPGNLTLGIVDSIDKDTNNTYKIKVKIHKFSDKVVDARMVQPYAGNGLGSDKQQGDNGEGMFFFPNVGAEVILTPIDGDESYWVILGCLYSPANKPSAEIKEGSTQPDPKNLHKSIVTKHFIFDFFDDDSAPTFNVSSRDKKQQITMEIKSDPHILAKIENTSVEISKERGITMKTDKDIKLTADGKIEMKGSEITATGDSKVGLKAPTVEVKGDTAVNVDGAQVKIKGSGPVNVESSAIASIKGSASTSVG